MNDQAKLTGRQMREAMFRSWGLSDEDVAKRMALLDEIDADYAEQLRRFDEDHRQHVNEVIEAARQQLAKRARGEAGMNDHTEADHRANLRKVGFPEHLFERIYEADFAVDVPPVMRPWWDDSLPSVNAPLHVLGWSVRVCHASSDILPVPGWTRVNVAYEQGGRTWSWWSQGE